MAEFELFETPDYRERSNIVREKLNEQKGFLIKIRNHIRFGRKINRILDSLKNSCIDPLHFEGTKPNFTTLNVIILYMHVKSPLMIQSINFDIECYSLCNYILGNPRREYSKKFISNMTNKILNWEWENKIEDALLSLNDNSPDRRTRTIIEFRSFCVQKISRSPHYILFVGALYTKEKFMKKLILLYVKTIDEILKAKPDKFAHYIIKRN